MTCALVIDDKPYDYTTIQYPSSRYPLTHINILSFQNKSQLLDEHFSDIYQIKYKQGKSEGFESCNRPIVQKRPIWVKIGDVLYRVTLKFDGWPWKTLGHLSFAVSSFVQHFIAIDES